MRGLSIPVGVALTTIALTTIGLRASASGPVPAHTGGFGEMTCHQCHWNNDLNSPSGHISLTGIPERYTPGERYPIIVEIAHPELMKAGFQMSARFDAGANAGEFRGVDDRTETIPDDAGTITYVQHTRAGSTVAVKGHSRWDVIWTAPHSDGSVVFHLAGNAANGDLSPLNDFIYAATATTRSR